MHLINVEGTNKILCGLDFNFMSVEMFIKADTRLKLFRLITGRNEVVAKVIFLLVSVILFTGGVYLSACWDKPGPLPRRRHCHPPPMNHPPRKEAHPPEGSTPPRKEATPVNTVNERPVRILLECILVCLEWIKISRENLYFTYRDDFSRTLVFVECQYIHKEPPCRHRDSNHRIGRSVPSIDLSLNASRNNLFLICAS